MITKDLFFDFFNSGKVLTRLAVLLSITFNLISCTKGDPKISLLKMNFPAPVLQNSTFNITSPSQSITISGSCDKRISELQMSKDQGTTWSAISSSTGDLSCSDEFFSFLISDPGAFLGTTTNASFKHTLLIAGVTKFGKTPAAEFIIEYIKSSGPTLSASDVVVQEDAGVATITVTLNSALDTPVTFDWSTVAGSAISSLDFTSSSGVGTVAAGATTTTLTIPIVNDAFYENPETFLISLSNPSVGSILTSQSMITITNDTDAMPTLAISNLTLGEGNSNPTTFPFVVTLSTVSGADVIVDYSTFDSTAISGSDYIASNGTIVIPAGQTSATFNIAVNGDTTYEPDEIFNASLSGGSGYTTTGATLSATGTIINDDTAPTITLGDVSYAEGNTGTSNMTFTITASSISGADVVVNYSATNLSAAAGSDFSGASGTATILAGQTTTTFNVVKNGDTMYEIDESFTMTLSGGNGYTTSGSDLTAIGIITNDDTAPTIAIGDVAVAEGNSSTTNMTFTITAAAVSGVDIVVSYSTSNGSAVVGADYSAASGVATILAGQTTTTFNVLLNGDTLYESSETLTATLISGSGYTPTGSDLAAVGTITNDDLVPTISIANVSQAEGVSSTTNMVFTVTLSTMSDVDVVVNYATGDITAIAGNDYVTNNNSLTIAAGQMSNTFSVSVYGNTLYELDETFSITLSGGSGYTAAGSTLTATGTILNDDTAPTISIADVSLTEGNSGSSNMSFSIIASGISGADIVVNYSTSSGTATAGTDYTTASGTATITAGQSSTSFNISINGDTAIESDESFSIALTGGSGYTTASSILAANGTILDDDNPVVAPLYVGNSDWNKYVKNDGATVYTASNTPCTGSETGNYRACIHSGTKRKVVLSGYSSCVNLTVTDFLGVFDWTCDDSSGTATFYSLGLKNGKGLRDLILAANGTWKSNYVTIYQSASPIATSTSTVWWSNPLQDLSSGGYNNSSTPSVYNLSTSGTVYYITTDLATYGYQIAADEISIVTLGTAKLTKYGPDTNFNCNISTGGYTSTAGNTVAILCGGNRRFIWIEANMDGVTGATYSAYNGLYAYDWRFSRINNSSVSPTHIGNSFYAVTLNNSHSNLVDGLDIYSVASGFELKNSTYNTIRNVQVSETKSTSANCRAISLDTASDYNKLYDIRVTNQMSTTTETNAFVVEGSDNVITRVNISNITGNAAGVAGIYLSATASNNILTQIVSSSTSDTGIKLVSADNNIISFYTSANNTWNGIYLDGTGTNGNLFNSIAITNTSDPIQSNSAGTYTSTTANSYNNLAISNYVNWAIHIQDSISTFSGYILAGASPTCAASGSNLNTGCSGSGVTVVASDIATALKGPATSDTANGTGTGIRTFSTINTHALWTFFDSFFRTWGKSGVGYPATGNQGYCNSASCQIWDYRVAISSVLHNRSISGNASNPTFTTGTCVAGTNGDLTLTANGMTFMKNAIEIEGDGYGNDNTLCESAERCIYAPNIGAYQGEGDYTAGGSCITTGTVVGAKIYQYPTTGI